MRCFSLGTIVLVGVLLGAQGVKAQSPSCTGDDPVEGVLWGIADDGGDGTYVAGTGGVIRSCNGGDTWTTPSPLQRSGLSVLVHPLNSSTIYFGTDRGVYRSTDFGSSYSPTGDNISGFVFSLGAQPDGTLFAGADSGIYRSDDDGNTWNALAGSPTGENIIALAVDPSNDQIIYAGTNGNGVYQSTDGGATWNAASNGNALWQVRDIEFDPVNPSILNVPSWDGIWRSVDAGANWNNLGFSRVVDMAFDPNDGTRAYAASWDFGVLRSTDGGTSWSALNTSFPTNRLYSLQVLSSGRVLVGTESEGLFRSDDGGDTWGLAGTPIPDPAPPPAPTPGYASLSAEVENLMGGSVAAGSQARFRITVTNDGPDTSTASSVDFSWVRNRLTGNEGYDYTLTTNQGSCMRSITPEPDCTIGTLAAGASVIIEFRGDTEPAALSNYILRVFANNNESAGGRVAEVTVGSRITVLSSDGGGGTLGYLTLLWLSWGLWSRKKTATMPKKTNVR
jgi:photosystem II stability/assembly factor-like uncharacterized protein